MEISEEQKEAIEVFEFCSNYNCALSKKRTEIILNLIEKLQKENEELNKENEHLHREINRRIKLKIENEKIVDTQFIYKQKIKDKIEELQKTNFNDYTKKQDGNNVKMEILYEFKKMLESE